MSTYERDNADNSAAVAEILDPKWLSRHRYSAPSFMESYTKLASEAAAKKLPGLRAIAPSVLAYISDEKTIFTALKYMDANGSHTPGPDGLRYEDITLVGDWKLCRHIRNEIRACEYMPGEERIQKISKGPGRGFRNVVVQSVEDRVVHRATVEVLQPLLDPLFDPRSFGFRPKKGPLRALATADNLHHEHNLGVWVSVDIKNAFSNVPIGRLLGILRRYWPDDELLVFLETITRPDKLPGLRQGSPLSPLLLNLYLHHILDRVWRERHPGVPLLRFADDILLLCRTKEQAVLAYQSLVSILRPAGFSLKENELEAIRFVDKGQIVNWMGFDISGGEAGLKFTIADTAWHALAEKLLTAHERPNSPLAAIASLVGWLRDKAPCFPHTNLYRAYNRIRQLAKDMGFDEIPTQPEVIKMWQLSYARWGKLKKSVAKIGNI